MYFLFYPFTVNIILLQRPLKSRHFLIFKSLEKFILRLLTFCLSDECLSNSLKIAEIP